LSFWHFNRFNFIWWTNYWFSFILEETFLSTFNSFESLPALWLFYYILPLPKYLKHILNFFAKHFRLLWILILKLFSDFRAIDFPICLITKCYKDLLFNCNIFSFLRVKKLLRLRVMIVLQLSSIDDPCILVSWYLSYRHSWFTLTLAKEVISFSVLVWSFIAWASSVTLTNKWFSNFFILISLVSTLSISDSS
jgi:hypothetical protein